MSLANAVGQLDGFVRVHFAFFTSLWALLGAASVGQDTSWTRLILLLVAVACFHVYAFVLNDVIDLPRDRANPSRQRDPLVRGIVRPKAALAIALAQPLITVPITIQLGGGWAAHATMAVACLAMAIYNVWGKRCPAPPLTDFVQGIAWGALALYAAHALGARPNALTWLVFWYGVAYTLFMNGVHGGLRDLASDFECGARTTAIVLGARPGTPGHDPHVPLAVAAFGWATLLLLVALNVVIVVRNDFGYDLGEWRATALVVGALIAGAVLLEPLVVRPRGQVWNVAFRLQMFLVIMSLPAAFVAFINIRTLLLLSVLMLVSMALLEWTPAIARWALHPHGRRRPDTVTS